MVGLIDTTGSYVRLVFKRQSSGACSIVVMIGTPDDWHIYVLQDKFPKIKAEAKAQAKSPIKTARRGLNKSDGEKKLN